jgi:hypothetical protein
VRVVDVFLVVVYAAEVAGTVSVAAWVTHGLIKHALDGEEL